VRDLLRGVEVMWWWGVLTGIGLTISFQVCFQGMRENDEQDLRDESWESIRAIQ